jgi:hypothetical protein
MAISLNDFRQKYPDYNDLSDQELADKLHDKFYSDIPKDDFYQRIGLNNTNANTQGASSIQDALNKSNYITGENRTPFDTVRDFSQGLLSGAAKGGELLNKGLMHIPGAQQLASSIHNRFFPNTNVSDEDVNNLINKVGSPNPSIGGNIVKGVASYLPYAQAGGPGLLGETLAGAGFGAATASPGQDLENEATKGALINALTHGAFQGLNKLRPSNLFRGNLSPEELKANMQAAGNTATNLGDVIGSPFLKRQYENVISKIPFSGATEKLQQVGSDVQNRGESLLGNLLSNNNPENVTDQLYQSLMDKFKQRRDEKNSLYDEFNAEADKQFLNLPLKKFSDLAKQNADALEDTNILKFDPDVKNILTKLNVFKNPVQKIPGNTTPVNQFGQPLMGDPLNTFVYPTAKEANLLKGKLNNAAETLKSSPDPADRFKVGIFRNLSSALKEDINDAIDQSGNPALRQKYDEAEQNYKTNFKPFLDRDVYKFIGGKGDPDTIVQSFVRMSRGADRGKLLSKIANTIEPEKKPLLAYAYFSRALDNEGHLNPAKLATLVKNLGQNQFKTLVPNDGMRKALLDYNRLYKMNTKSVNLMQNPATGQQNLDRLPGLLAYAGSSLAGGAIGHLPGALAGLIAPGLISRPLVSYLTSPGVRESIIEKMIKNKPWNKNIIPGIQSGIQGTINSK